MGVKGAMIRRGWGRTQAPVSSDTGGSSEGPPALTFLWSLEISLEVGRTETVGLLFGVFFPPELSWTMVSTVKQLGSSWKNLSGFQLAADASMVAAIGTVSWCESLVCRKDENNVIKRNSEATSWLTVNVQDSCWAWLPGGDWEGWSWHTFSPVFKDCRGSC